MKAQELREIANRLLRMANEMEGLTTERGAVKVSLPGASLPDLFSMLEKGEAQEIRQTNDGEGTVETLVDGQPVEVAPTSRSYARVGCKMKDDVIVAADAMKVGRETGYCQRSDIERSLLRKNPDASREAIREAVNEAVAQLGLLCITHNSYRYYRSVDRRKIIEVATARLCA